MPVVLNATVNDPAANSFLTLEEGQAYWETRLFSDPWDNSDDQEMALILATRTMVSMLAPRREFVAPAGGQSGYFILHPTWTGLPATTTQRLPWGRIGMLDRNGNLLAGDVLPQELKDATAELAGQIKEDSFLDNDVRVQGISSVSAGSVSVAFNNAALRIKMLPDIVLALLVPTWLTNQTIEPMYSAEFDVVS